MNDRQPACRQPYRGRLAPSPTGWLHLGHARTFWVAQARAQAQGGILVLRNEDLDSTRYRMEFAEAMFEDLKWFGFDWQEGPDCGGPFGPYAQSERRKFYVAALEQLRAAGWVYPCTCSRKDILNAARAPHAEDEREPIYPGTCRTRSAGQPEPGARSPAVSGPGDASRPAPGTRFNWRFRVPEGETISFVDGHYGAQHFVAGRDFGDFVVWRQVDEPSYQLACTVDDAAMQITEVVRGADLLPSTARQLLLYRALGWTPPQFYHCALTTDEAGVRLAKRHDALSLRRLREAGHAPVSLRAGW
ncbi:MAG TPA: tRNA glutamyl-Q(34) synthetase GluQRS [Candidatus Acidoferrum sp.]|nr:tRNA glutamyl-Q(34) synthetase GluQRS [Candidatus Acidoferrum sp.]